MIEAVRAIGDYIQQRSGGGDSLSTYIENPNSNGKYNCVLAIVLSELDGRYSFSCVVQDEFKNPNLYLYKKGAPNGTDATPTCKVAGKLDKTFSRFMKWFENYESYDIPEQDRDVIKKMNEALVGKKDEIIAELNKNYSQKDAKTNAIITLGIGDGENYSYPCEQQIFKNILLRTGRDKYYSKKSQGESLGKNAICSVCRQKKEEVYGFAIPWSFHTFDKPGFIAGGFNVNESWKNTPVCFDCATRLEVGKKYVEERLDFGFYGFRYLLVPKLAFGEDFNGILSILGAKDQKRKLKLNKEVKNSITSDEEEILDLVKDKEDFISNSLIFYRKEQASYRILLLIEGILPSRLKALFDIKDLIDERFKIYNDLLLSEAQKEKNHLEFNFGVLRRFFPQESKNRTFDKIFLEIVDKVFVGDKIDYYLLIKFITRKARESFKGGYPTNIATLNGFLLLNYLKELDLVDVFKEMNEVDENKDKKKTLGDLEGLPLEQKVEAFFRANGPFFTSDAKKAVFLEGVLTQNLLNIQWRDKNATPFRTKLHGLKINEALIKKLLPEIQNKLEEYGKNYYRELESIIAKYFILSGADWEETDDELSFYFVLGMDMQKLFRNEKEDDGKTGEEA